MDTGVELYNDSFVNLDASEQLVRQQCKQLTAILNELSRSRDVSPKERRELLPGQPWSGKMSTFYGMPKVHKIGTLLLRPIISTIGLYSDALMVRLKEILNLLLWGSTVVANSYEFVQLLESFQFGEHDRMLSYDVKSLFTKVPVEQSLEIIQDRLEQMFQLPSNPIKKITTLSVQAIMRLLSHGLKQCYFSWDSVL